MRPSDINQVRMSIRQQQRKVQKDTRNLTVQLATLSKYKTLSRPERRQAEHHMDEVQREQNLQRDVHRATVMARRVAQVLDKLHKDTNSIKNMLGNYSFANTTGVDSTGSGDCNADLTADVGTRQAWKRELMNKITNTMQYVEAQHLGDYALLHSTPPTAAAGDCSSTCCPKKYRSEFHYTTPSGDCMSVPESMGVAFAATTDTPEGTNDAKQTPGRENHTRVSNPDSKYWETYKLVVEGDAALWEQYMLDEIDRAQSDANPGFAVAKAADEAEGGGIFTRRIAEVTRFVLEESCLPQSMAEAVTVATETVETESGPVEVTVTDENGDVMIDASGAAVAANAPTIGNIEDESDMRFILRHFTEKMNKLRQWQERNDREQQVLSFVKETSECNQAFHQDQLNDHTRISESEVRARHAVAKKLTADLDKIYKEVSVTKQSLLR